MGRYVHHGTRGGQLFIGSRFFAYPVTIFLKNPRSRSSGFAGNRMELSPKTVNGPGASRPGRSTSDFDTISFAGVS